MSETTAPQDARPAGRRRLWIAGAAAAVVLILGAGTWWVHWSARVVWPGEGSFGMTLPADGELGTWSLGAMSVCLEGIDAAVVHSVEVERGDAVVTDFLFRPHPDPDEEGTVMFLGAEPVELATTAFGGERAIRGRCENEAYTELAVELSRPAGRTARADGLLVHWSAGLRSGVLRVPGTFVLCDAPTGGAPECEL